MCMLASLEYMMIDVVRKSSQRSGTILGLCFAVAWSSNYLAMVLGAEYQVWAMGMVVVAGVVGLVGSVGSEDREER